MRVLGALVVPTLLSLTACCSTYATHDCLIPGELDGYAESGEWERLDAYLADERSWVREEAALVLGEHVASHRRASLERVLANREERPWVRAAAADALGRIADPASLPALEGALAERGLPGEVKVAVIMAACRLSDAGPGAAQAITPLTADEDLLVATIAAEHLRLGCGGAR